MNARAFREAVERRIIDERAARLADKGVTLPKDTRIANEHQERVELAVERKSERQARLAAVAEAMEAGLTTQEIALRLGITERQAIWNRRKVKQAEASREVVTR